MKGCESYLELLKLNVEETPVIAVVGGAERPA